MASPVALAVSAILVLYALRVVYRLRSNIAKARSSGLPYVVMPFYVYDIWWLSTYRIWLPLLGAIIPPAWKGIWFQILHPEWAYLLSHKPFAEIGSDAFFAVSPSKIQVFVADAEAITQITTRRNDFPKPLDMYHSLDIYGKNVVSTEGSLWRLHRKLTAPSFSEKNNELVFVEALHHAQELMTLWAGPEGRASRTITNPHLDIMRFALYLISRAGFGVRVFWPHEEEKALTDDRRNDGTIRFGSMPANGHKMSYREALSTLLYNIVWTQVFPQSFLVKSPIKIHRDVGLAVAEWGKYMDELYESRKKHLASGGDSEGMDLFAALIKGSGILDASDKAPKNFQKSDLLGNAFVIMLAGHETTANTLHYALILLAMNPAAQKRLQEDLDSILQGKPANEWSFEDDFPRLFAGMPAAVMNETLRLYQPVINIPKTTVATQPLTLQGKRVLIPAGTYIQLTCAVHRNPKCWPAIPDENGHEDPDDVNQFKPQRWFHESKSALSASDRTDPDNEDIGGPGGADTSSHLFKPVRGSFIPFSDGFRSCIGRRFAQVELLAAIAVIFKSFSVELAVDEFASDSEIEALPRGGKERKEIWDKARGRADHLLRKTMTTMITLQMRDGNVPLRFVRRGEERFEFE